MTKKFNVSENSSGQSAQVDTTPTCRQKAITGRVTETRKRKRTSAKNTTKKFRNRLCDQNVENQDKHVKAFLAVHKNEVISDLLETSNDSEAGVCTIRTDVFGERISMIVDTGSDLTIMSEICYKRILARTNVSVKIWPANDFNICGITSKKRLNILKKAEIDVNFFNGKEIPTKFLIAKNFGTSPILGNNFLTKYNATVDYPGGELHLNFNGKCITVPFKMKRDQHIYN